MVSYVTFVLSFIVPYLLSFMCVEKALLRDCGIYLGILKDLSLGGTFPTLFLVRLGKTPISLCIAQAG